MHCLIPPTLLGWYTKRLNLLVPTPIGGAPLVQKGEVGKTTTCEIQVKYTLTMNEAQPSREETCMNGNELGE